MTTRIPEKILMLFDVVDKFIHISDSMDFLEKEDAEELIESALKKINSILGTVAAEVCTISEVTTDKRVLMVFKTFKSNFKKYYTEERQIDYEIDTNIHGPKKNKNEGKLRSHLYEYKVPIWINKFKWDWQSEAVNNDRVRTINVAPNIPEEHKLFDDWFEPLLYSYGYSTILIPLKFKLSLIKDKETGCKLKTKSHLLGYFHIEHEKYAIFDEERYLIPQAKKYDIRNPVDDLSLEWSQYDILFRFSIGISRLLSKSVEWDIARKESKTVINRFKTFSLNHSGTIIYKEGKSDSSNMRETLIASLRSKNVEFAQPVDYTQISNLDIDSTSFGILLIDTWDSDCAFIAGKLIGKGKNLIIFRPKSDTETDNNSILSSSKELQTCFYIDYVDKNRISIVEGDNEVAFDESKVVLQFINKIR